jgi:hypothetical protein
MARARPGYLLQVILIVPHLDAITDDVTGRKDPIRK